jgi:hypothetical protein
MFDQGVSKRDDLAVAGARGGPHLRQPSLELLGERQ